jgi:hypothetical protein
LNVTLFPLVLQPSVIPYACICMYVFVHVCMYVMYICTHVSMYVRTHVRTYASIHNSAANKDMGNVLSKRVKGTTFTKECDRETTETDSTKESSMSPDLYSALNIFF